MRKFRININGKSYEVEVEEIISQVPSTVSSSGIQTAVSETAASKAPTTRQSAATHSAPKMETNEEHSRKNTAGKTGSIKVNSPMPGTILDIRVNAGARIKKGQVVLILEAMKMENEIMAPQDGIITSIDTNIGASVNSGDLLFTMEVH
ncbi:MAG: biotin/lipoyl-binding protein [Clostridiales bacterium]|nr:biotin/lipoyl-binding protein [Clostridiales bacterium]